MPLMINSKFIKHKRIVHTVLGSYHNGLTAVSI